MMVDPLILIVQISRLFLIEVSPMAVSQTTVVFCFFVISHQIGHTGILQIMIPGYLFTCMQNLQCLNLYL